MKTLLQILNKHYDKNLLDYKTFRKDFESKQTLLKECAISNDAKTDSEVLHVEMVYHSIAIKQKFEDVFFDTFVHMFDYWYDLTYLERKKQMNMDIERLMETLPYFMEGKQKIFMPCFDVAFNHLYTDEIVLLDLKQYHAFIRTFTKEIKEHMYGVRSFEIGSTSADVILADDQMYVLYHSLTHRLYLYQNDHFVHALSLDPKCTVSQYDHLKELATAFMSEDEDAMIAILNESELISSKMQKKLTKYQSKKDKKKNRKGDNKE